MIEETITLKNRLGLHVRAAAKLVQTASTFDSSVTIHSEGNEADAKSILGILQLLAGKGTPLRFRVEGPDETQAITALRELIDRRFDESD